MNMDAYSPVQNATERGLLQQQLFRAYRTIGTHESQITHLQQELQHAHAREAFLVEVLQQNNTSERQNLRPAAPLHQSHAVIYQSRGVPAGSGEELARVNARLNVVETEQAESKARMNKLQANLDRQIARNDASHQVNGGVDDSAARVEDLIDVWEGVEHETTTPTVVNTSSPASFLREVPQGWKMYFDRKPEKGVTTGSDGVDYGRRVDDHDRVSGVNTISHTDRVHHEGRVREVHSIVSHNFTNTH